MRQKKTVAISSVKSIPKASFPLVETGADNKLYFRYVYGILGDSLANYDLKVSH